ncbi:unnamed protein product [Cladocopium goreaui]|uniref:Uncharacterized protein n=1 Tax=Cladocopium goreaui TaxID=2562237 RepID=A0A9P1D820_9DINO|nr:unnamed protein product [Cladocopium goreaui]
MATMVSPDQLVWRRPPHLLDPLMVEHMPQHPPTVGDEALQHWINRVRWHSDRAVLAGRAAAKAEALAEEVSKKVIQMVGGVLPDHLNLAAHRAQLTEGDGAKDLSTPGSQDSYSTNTSETDQQAANKAEAMTQPVQQTVGAELIPLVPSVQERHRLNRGSKKSSFTCFLCDAVSKNCTWRLAVMGLISSGYTWRFPKIGVPQNHPF